MFVAYVSAGWMQFVELSDQMGGRLLSQTEKKTKKRAKPFYIGPGFIYVAGFFSHLVQFLLRFRLAPLLWNEISDERAFCGWPSIQEAYRNGTPIEEFLTWKNIGQPFAETFKQPKYGSRLSQTTIVQHFRSICFMPCVRNDSRCAGSLNQMIANLAVHAQKCEELKKPPPHTIKVYNNGGVLVEPTKAIKHGKGGVLKVCICSRGTGHRAWKYEYPRATRSVPCTDDVVKTKLRTKMKKRPSDRAWPQFEPPSRNLPYSMHMKKAKGFYKESKKEKAKRAALTCEPERTALDALVVQENAAMDAGEMKLDESEYDQKIPDEGVEEDYVESDDESQTETESVLSETQSQTETEEEEEEEETPKKAKKKKRTKTKKKVVKRKTKKKSPKKKPVKKKKKPVKKKKTKRKGKASRGRG